MKCALAAAHLIMDEDEMTTKPRDEVRSTTAPTVERKAMVMLALATLGFAVNF